MNSNFKTLALILMMAVPSCSGSSIGDIVIPPIYKDDEDGGGGGDDPSDVLNPYKVDCRKDKSASWTKYDAYAVNCIQGFKMEADPEVDEYGGWTIRNLGNNTGFFHVEKASDRWWLVDPKGNIYLSKGVAVFSPGSSARQKANITSKFGSNTEWAKTESSFLKEIGFNSLGAWSEVNTVRNLPEKMPYTVILSPMGTYNGYLKSSGKYTAAFNYKSSPIVGGNWEGYPYNFPRVFDAEFDAEVENTLSKAAEYKNDPYLIGYFIDNEIPWKPWALEICLTKWDASDVCHQKAQQWLDSRKGKAGCTMADVTEADKNAFIAFCYETYLQKVTASLRKYDPNHLFLGDRFNQWNYELVNEEMFKVAGKYCDVISINHYQKWQPDQDAMRNWSAWSGKPFMVTEFYTKGEDAEGGEGKLTNGSGAGWLVRTQNDRGLFYENFVVELLKSKVCVGWHWFTYMDNDPENAGADTSNTNSNKGIVSWNCTRYNDLVDRMKEINECVYRLTAFYSK